MKEIDLIKEKNYIGAYYIIKNNTTLKEERVISLGKLANYILEDLSKEKDSNKSNFLKSILLLISKEIPGFYEVYIKENKANDVEDILSSTKNVYDVVQGKKTISEGILDSIETNGNVLKRNIESIASRAQKTSDADLLSSTTNILIDGIDGFTNILKQINENIVDKKSNTDNYNTDK